MALQWHPLDSRLLSRDCVLSGATVWGIVDSVGNTAASFNWKRSIQCNVGYHVMKPYIGNNFRRIAWRTKSSADGSGLNSSSFNGNNGGTRLLRVIKAFQTRLGAKLQGIKKNLPIKLFFFLVGFYCATAFATVIGQTGDWDILSAALAVVVVEGIGALMYRATLPIFNNIRGLISMFNYWKAGLSLGLFLDSFKYDIDNIISNCNPLGLDWDIFSLFT